MRGLPTLLLSLALLGLPAGVMAEPVRVGLYPIAVHSADASTQYLKNGLAEMMTARLERSGELEIVPLREEEGEYPTPDEIFEVAEDADVAYVVFGAFTQFGAGASLDMRCSAVGSDDEEMQRARRVFIQSGTLGEIIPKLDQLSQKIVRHLVPEEAADSGAVVSSGGANGDIAYDDLRERVDALERAVYAPGVDPLAAGDLVDEIPEDEVVETLEDLADEIESIGPAPE